jgi:hypothetical protein
MKTIARLDVACSQLNATRPAPVVDQIMAENASL